MMPAPTPNVEAGIVVMAAASCRRRQKQVLQQADNGIIILASSHNKNNSPAFQMPLFVMVSVLLLLTIGCLAVGTEGYNIDRLLLDNGRNGGLSESQQLAMLRQYQNTETLWRSANKKSPEYNGQKLTQFQGNGARNCFFTPIQCMLQHDVNKLRRMVDPADIGQVS